MKALELSFVIIFVFAFASRVKTLDPLLQDVQALLSTRNPNCVAYRDAVNNYIKAKFPAKMCQLQCNNRDYSHAESFPKWYIPNFLPIEPKDCGTKVDDCNYKFDSKYIFGKIFYGLLDNPDLFISAILEKSYLVLCNE